MGRKEISKTEDSIWGAIEKVVRGWALKRRGWALKGGVHVILGHAMAVVGEGVLEGEGERARRGGPHSLVSHMTST